MERTYLCVLLVSVLMACSAHKEDCERVVAKFQSKDLPGDIKGTDFLRFDDDMLFLTEGDNRAKTVCGSRHCCTDKMQEQLFKESRLELHAHRNHAMHVLRDLEVFLRDSSERFDSVFREMLKSSKMGFHAMFTKTYGVIYEQNAYLFTDLFGELEKYYSRGQVDLTTTLDDFFNTLYQKMFTVLNAGYSFTDKYLECVNEQMKELKPFGDVPSKLTTLLKRSFYATRTFHQSLRVAADVMRNMQIVPLAESESCHQAYTNLFRCSQCHGYEGLQPCHQHCISLMKGCFGYLTQLEAYWNSFIDSSDKVIDRLLGPFNIEVVILPIDIKISEAIMNFQENSNEVSQRIFASCGKPLLGRAKRANGEIEFETLDFSKVSGLSGLEGGRGGKEEEPGKLERVIRDIRPLLKESKTIWQRLPTGFCNSSLKASPCWDGSAEVVSINNPAPDIKTDLGPNSVFNEQIFALRYTTSKLKNAYNGVDVEWIDSEGMDSGSGSGSGSGIDTSESGSGDSPTQIPEEPTNTNFPASGTSPPHWEDNNRDKPQHPIEDDNKEPNEIPPIPDLSRAVNTTRARAATGSASRMASFSFLVPIIMVAFGDTVIDFFK